jgi:hypothetical protein
MKFKTNINDKKFSLSYNTVNKSTELSIYGYQYKSYESSHKLGNLFINFIHTDLDILFNNDCIDNRKLLKSENNETLSVEIANYLISLHPYLFVLYDNYYEFIDTVNLKAISDVDKMSDLEKLLDLSSLQLEKLRNLQKKYSLLIDFCYNEEPDLKNMSTLDKYNLFTKIYPRKDTFNNMVHYDLVNETKISNLSNPRLFSDLDNIEKLTDYLKIPEVQHIIKELENNTTTIKNTYEVNIDSACQFELLELIKNDLNLKKCENCHKYFIVYSRADTKYCNREFSEDGKTCREIGAIKAYQEKNKENPIIKMYSKFYKRNHARIKYKNLSKIEFEKWQKNASFKKKEALNSDITLEEFENWLQEEEVKYNANYRKKR